MVKSFIPRQVSRAVPVLALLISSLAPAQATTAHVTAIASTTAGVIATSGSWRAALAAQNSSPTVGAPLGILTTDWLSGHRYASPIGKTDTSYFFDAVNTGSLTLTGQNYLLSVTQFDAPRVVSLWVCTNGLWVNQKCQGNINQIGTSQTISANGNYIFQTGNTTTNYTLSPTARLSLLITSTGNGMPTGNESISISVSRTLSVTPGVVSNS